MKIGFENMAIAEIKKQCAKYGIGLPELSMHIKVIPIRIYEIINGKRRVTIDTDLRLCRFFKLKIGHFMKMQLDYDYRIEEEKLVTKLKEIKTVDEIVRKNL